MKSMEKLLNTDKVIMPFDKPDTEIWVEKIANVQSKPFYNLIKRLLDIIVSIVGIIIFILPMFVIYMIIAATSEGKPIYKQERLGINGKKFYIYKFRTMYIDAESEGAQWSISEDDERITPVGRFLRRSKLDELPQLFNCLLGDISLVGPRPEREIFYKCFETYIHGFSQRLLVKPGITGLAQIKGGSYIKPEEKIIYDIEYIKSCSLWLDLKILMLTLFVVISDKYEK